MRNINGYILKQSNLQKKRKIMHTIECVQLLYIADTMYLLLVII